MLVHGPVPDSSRSRFVKRKQDRSPSSTGGGTRREEKWEFYDHSIATKSNKEKYERSAPAEEFRLIERLEVHVVDGQYASLISQMDCSPDPFPSSCIVTVAAKIQSDGNDVTEHRANTTPAVQVQG